MVVVRNTRSVECPHARAHTHNKSLYLNIRYFFMLIVHAVSSRSNIETDNKIEYIMHLI